MRAVILLAPGELECREVRVPTPGPGEVLLKVASALTCGTDLKAFVRGHPKMPPPTRFGHEYSGTIAEVGRGVENFREGDEVMLAPTGPCNICEYCLRSQENLCTSIMSTMAFGGYAEYVILPHRVVRTNMFLKPRWLPFVKAAMLEPISCVVYGLGRVALNPEKKVVIIGAGGFGLLHLMVLRVMGVHDVSLIAKNPHRAAVAKRLGTPRIIDRPAEESREEVWEATGGKGADLVIECTARPAVWEESLFLARPGGQVILFGGCPPGTKVSFDATRLHYDQVQMVSPFHFNPAAVAKAVEFIESGEMPTEHLVSGSYKLEQIERAFGKMQKGEGIKYEILP